MSYESTKRWRLLHPDESRKRSRDYSRKRRADGRQYADAIKKKYGLTIENYNALLEKQGGVCALCGVKPCDWKNLRQLSEEDGRKKRKLNRLAVDHNHVTGKVRGLLCVSCNRALGCLGDTEEAILKVLDYLRRSL